jgi:hypothetical protein
MKKAAISWAHSIGDGPPWTPLLAALCTWYATRMQKGRTSMPTSRGLRVVRRRMTSTIGVKSVTVAWAYWTPNSDLKEDHLYEFGYSYTGPGISQHHAFAISLYL